MIPEDDASWPRCIEHIKQHWCDTTRTILLEGGDANSIQPGTRICVPITPTEDLYAEVSIDSKDTSGLYKMAIVKPVEQFSIAMDDEELIDVGFWMPGDGRFTISATIQQHAESEQPERCTYTKHGLEAERELKRMEQDAVDPLMRANRWTLFCYNKCLPCWRMGQRILGNWNNPDDNFGLGSMSSAIKARGKSVRHVTPPGIQINYQNITNSSTDIRLTALQAKYIRQQGAS